MTGYPQPLAGKRILDLSRYLPGPYATRQLHAHGAEIIKIEHPKGGDPLRTISPALFEDLNRGKKSVALDLRAEGGPLLALAAACDAVIDGFRPGYLDGLGIGADAMRARNPRLVWCGLSGFGRGGPYAGRAAHDMATLAIAGFFSAPSSVSGRIARPNVRLADLEAGNKAALAVTMALWQAERTGAGATLDVSMFDCVAAMAAPMALAAPPGDDIHGMWQVMADSDLYETADGRALALATLEDKFWAAFAEAARDLEPALAEPRFATRAGRDADKPRLAGLIAGAVGRVSLAAWEARLDGVDTCWGPVRRGAEILEDPHVAARGLLDRAAGHVAFPVMVDGAREPTAPAAPALGAHTAEVLGALAPSNPRGL